MNKITLNEVGRFILLVFALQAFMYPDMVRGLFINNSIISIIAGLLFGFVSGLAVFKFR